MKQSSDGVLVNGSQMPYGDKVNGSDQVKSQDMGLDGANIDTVAVEKMERSSDGESKERKSSVSRQTDQRKINKGTKRETAPRFQSMTKGKGTPTPVMMNGDIIGEKKKVPATMEDVPKSVTSIVSILEFT